jgi:hypothetical protein
MWEGLGTAWDSLKSFRRFIFENSRSFRTELRACRRRLQYSSASSLIRRVGRFLLNLLIAVMGTAVIESGFHPAFRPGSFALLDAVAAFGLGCTVNYRWRLGQWQWVGFAGLCWFGLGIFRLWADGAPAIYRVLSGLGCVYDQSAVSCTYFPLFTLLSIRAVCYSAGALCCLRIEECVRRRREPSI